MLGAIGAVFAVCGAVALGTNDNGVSSVAVVGSSMLALGLSLLTLGVWISPANRRAIRKRFLGLVRMHPCIHVRARMHTRMRARTTADIEICTVDHQKQTPHKIKTEFMPVQVRTSRARAHAHTYTHTQHRNVHRPAMHTHWRPRQSSCLCS